MDTPTADSPSSQPVRNSELSWSFEEVDNRLRDIMSNAYHSAAEAAARYGMAGNLAAGANIASFLKISDAMLAQGLV